MGPVNLKFWKKQNCRQVSSLKFISLLLFALSLANIHARRLIIWRWDEIQFLNIWVFSITLHSKQISSVLPSRTLPLGMSTVALMYTSANVGGAKNKISAPIEKGLQRRLSGTEADTTGYAFRRRRRHLIIAYSWIPVESVNSDVGGY